MSYNFSKCMNQPNSYLITYCNVLKNVQISILKLHANEYTCKISTLSRPILGPTEPPMQLVPWALSPGVKRQRREADHSPLTSVEVKKTWIYTATPPIRLHGVVLSYLSVRTALPFLTFLLWFLNVSAAVILKYVHVNHGEQLSV
jgi:hypothetical protein